MHADHALLNQVADALSATTITPYTSNPAMRYIVMPSGWWLYLSSVGRDGKIEAHMDTYHHPTINGMSDHFYNPAGLPTRIAFSASKSPAQMAIDINRRLVPNADLLWQKAVAARAARNKYESDLESQFVALNAAWPGIDDHSIRHSEPTKRTDGHFRGRTRFINKGYLNASDRTLNIELTSIPLSIAIPMLTALHAQLKDQL